VTPQSTSSVVESFQHLVAGFISKFLILSIISPKVIALSWNLSSDVHFIKKNLLRKLPQSFRLVFSVLKSKTQVFRKTKENPFHDLKQ
jgi:hypothetical protein